MVRFLEDLEQWAAFSPTIQSDAFAQISMAISFLGVIAILGAILS